MLRHVGQDEGPLTEITRMRVTRILDHPETSRRFNL